MRFLDIVEVSRRVGEAGGRLEKTAEIAALLRAVPPHAAEIVVAFLSGRIRQGRIGIGDALLREARVPPAPASSPASSHASSPAPLDAPLDAPSHAPSHEPSHEPSDASSRRPASAPSHRRPLSLLEVDASFDRIASVSGAGSAAERRRILQDLFGRATAPEQDFLVRLLHGELRQGALEGVMADAVARACDVSVAVVRRALLSEGRIERVAAVALGEGEAGLQRLAVRLFQPVRPMLAQPVDDVGEALERHRRTAFEYKLDGARVQIHKSGEDVRVYSRKLLEVTPALPEIVRAVRALPARELILDGETLALRADGTPHPFQTTMRRFGRRTDVERLEAELPLSLFLFDALYEDGRVLADLPYEERIARLERLQRQDAPAGADPHSSTRRALRRLPRSVVDEPDAAAAFLDASLSAGHEGILAKSLVAPYEAGSRGAAWLKIKKVETLDLVVLAAEWGSGRRQCRLSNLHLGARDPVRNTFVMLGKTFKGLTDAMLEWQTRRFLELEIGREGPIVHLRPEVVVEVAFSDVQSSPRYPGGLALRFARVKRYRTDKRPDEIDTIDRVLEIHRRSGG